jgi:hypothetical protein
MSWLRQRWLPLSVLLAAAGLLVASLEWTVANAAWGPTGPRTATAIPGTGRVTSLAAAERAAARFAAPHGLEVGEVMQFKNGFYATLVDPAGNGATEVLVDPASGAVRLEWGPAMMWNTAYGMHPGRQDTAASVQPQQAVRIARAWLNENRPGERPGEAEAFPGYYTLHTLRGGQISGMLSVHAASGAVWYHDWHGQFIQMQGSR